MKQVLFIILTLFLLIISSSSQSLTSLYSYGSAFCASGPTAIIEVANPSTGKTCLDRNLSDLQAATCPSGYRLPTSFELDTERQSWSSYNSAGAFASPLKFPVAGSREYNAGSVGSVGSLGHYWSSTINGIYVNLLRISSGTGGTGIFGLYRASGFSVRCLKD